MSMSIVTEVFCTLQFQGIHNWPGCPIEAVKYLRDPHRHMFHVRAHKKVYHNDRDVEFINLKNHITAYIANLYPDGQMGSTSCEMLASLLMKEFDLCRVEVNEDGENGSVMYAVEGAVNE